MSHSRQQPDMIRVGIVDDHAIVRSGLSMLLASEPDMVLAGEAGTLDDALQMIRENRPDIVLVDITLKSENGLDLVRRLKRDQPDVKTIILSMHDERDYADRALKAGASGYVMKEIADDVAVDAIREVMRGRLFLSPEVSSNMLRKMVSGKEDGKSGGADALTDREREIFECIGSGMSTKAIAEQFGLSVRTVEVHRAHIKKKLGCENAAQVVREAVRWVEQRR